MWLWPVSMAARAGKAAKRDNRGKARMVAARKTASWPGPTARMARVADNPVNPAWEADRAPAVRANPANLASRVVNKEASRVARAQAREVREGSPAASRAGDKVAVNPADNKVARRAASPVARAAVRPVRAAAAIRCN